MKLPKYTTKDYMVLLWVIIPFSIVLNTLIFGTLYYSKWYIFVLATLISAIAFSIDFILCGFVAVTLKSRFPGEKDLVRKLTLMIFTFLIITGLFLFSMFKGYEAIGFFGYTFNDSGFIWSYIAMGIFNIFLTFLHEGISRYEEWKANQKEMEQVTMAYRKSQLMGLKSQINPHFLFNSLNSLSSLISEDEEAAEKFLNELSKIYRYMLRNDDDKFVPLSTELNFIKSYFYLLNARYSTAVQLKIDVSEADKQKSIPPLTLQHIIENTIAQNAFSKSMPLKVFIGMDGTCMMVKHNIQRKIGSELVDAESGFDNLVEKYKLLHETPFYVQELNNERTIHVPLIDKNEMAAV
jgi:two-component system, LytTR family, sensor kinase